jgi:hypothetical protein
MVIVCKQQEFGGERPKIVCKDFPLLPEIEMLQEGFLIIPPDRELNLAY